MECKDSLGCLLSKNFKKRFWVDETGKYFRMRPGIIGNQGRPHNRPDITADEFHRAWLFPIFDHSQSFSMRRFILYLLIILSVSAGCSSRGKSQLSKGLTLAVKEKKISQTKMEAILTEYNNLREDDKKTAQEYVLQVLSAIEMGGDSSHIDAVRRQILKSKSSKTKV